MKITLYYTDHSEFTINGVTDYYTNDENSKFIVTYENTPVLQEREVVKNIDGCARKIELKQSKFENAYEVSLEHVAGIVIRDNIVVGDEIYPSRFVVALSERFHSEFSVTPKNKERRNGTTV